MTRGQTAGALGIGSERILIVDDEPAVREVLARLLAAEGFCCETAAGVAEAKQRLDADSFSLIVSDILMPGESGLDLLAAAREAHGDDIAVVIITAVDDRETALRALELGAYGYVTKPLDENEVIINVVNALARRRLAMATKERHDRLESEKERLEADLRVAREIQELLFPQELGPLDGFELAARCVPARQVSGDFYDFIRFPYDKSCVLVGDACGKGLGAALHMSRVLSYFRAAAYMHYSPHDLIHIVNRFLLNEWSSDSFVTACLVALDARRDVVSLYNAGHCPPYVWRQRAGSLEALTTQDGLPLGVKRGAVFDCRETQLETGDLVVLYTDGITEALDRKGGFFGTGRLEGLLRDKACSADVLADSLLAAVAEFTEGVAQSDDQTLVVIRKCDSDTPEPHP